MTIDQTNKPAVISPDNESDPQTGNFQRPDVAGNNEKNAEGMINLNKSEEAEKVKETGVAPNKGEQDGGAGS